MREFTQIVPILTHRYSYFATYRIAHEFRREVESRQALTEYCQWYRQTAEAHQQELTKLKQDINLMGWFNRQKSNPKR